MRRARRNYLRHHRHEWVCLHGRDHRETRSGVAAGELNHCLPGRNSPLTSASSMIWRAIRSFFEKPGDRYSNLARMRPLPLAVIRDSSTMGVSPITSTTDGNQDAIGPSSELAVRTDQASETAEAASTKLLTWAMIATGFAETNAPPSDSADVASPDQLVRFLKALDCHFHVACGPGNPPQRAAQILHREPAASPLKSLEALLSLFARSLRS